MTHRLEFFEDPRAFLARAAGRLEADPVVGTVVASVTARIVESLDAGQPRPDHPLWWLAVSDEQGEVVGLAMRTAPFVPHPVFVLPMPAPAARQVARALVDRGEELSGINGALPAAEVMASELARRTGRRAWVHEHTRLHVLESLVEPRAPAGRARVAGPADAELALAWFTAFHTDAAEQSGRAPDPGSEEQFGMREVAERVDHGRVWLWEDDHGVAVSLVGFNPPSFGVARIGPVYTPRDRRGRGFASALTAHVSRLLRDSGSRVCLYTDQANPTSNKIYAAIGYAPVVDMANLAIDGLGNRLGNRLDRP